MRDFKQTGDSLATVDIYEDIYKKGFNCFGCVINTDRSTGGGIHWMAIFGDFRSPNRFTVEIFNSSGQTPSNEFGSWVLNAKTIMSDIIEKEKIKNITASAIKVCGVKQQKSRTECGPYSLYYIWARLNNVPPELFLKHRIEDEKMFEFRQHLFWNKSAIFKPGENFDYDKFKQIANPKWE
jgi:hypothetical protein